MRSPLKKTAITHSPDEDCTRLYSLRECISFVSDAPLLRGKKFSSSWQPIAFALDVVKCVLCSLYKFCPRCSNSFWRYSWFLIVNQIRQGPFSNGSPDNVDDFMRQHSMPVVFFVKANDSKTAIKLFSSFYQSCMTWPFFSPNEMWNLIDILFSPELER